MNAGTQAFAASIVEMPARRSSLHQPTSRRLPLAFSARITPHPAARNACCCTVRSWSSVETRA